MNRKKIHLLLLIGFYCSVNIMSQTVSMQTVISVAETYANTNQQTDANGLRSFAPKQVSFVDAMERNGEPYLYFANMENGGWVIVANEERMSPILGFSDTGTFTSSDTINMPPALLFLLEEYMDEIDSIRISNTQIEVDDEIEENWIQLRNGGVHSINGYAVFPLLGNNDKYPGSENLWGQSGTSYNKHATCEHSYNKFCDTPTLCSEDGCNKHLVGCTAVAMAQVMWYWRWPHYATVNGQDHFYDWEAMPNRTDNNTDIYSVDMIARVMHDAGQAGGMLYTCSGSAMLLSDGMDALKNTFKFSSNVKQIESSIFMSKKTWGNYMRNELNVGRPVIFQGLKLKGVDSSIHTFVVDGYQQNDNNMFHLNLGWRGEYNADYNLSSFYGYKYNKSILTDLYPNCLFELYQRDINGVNYTSIPMGYSKVAYASNTLNLCNNGKSLSVEPISFLNLMAGNEIVLKPGFHAKYGSFVNMNIRTLPPCGQQQPSFLRSMAIVDLEAQTEELENNLIEKEQNEFISEKTAVQISPNPFDNILHITFTCNETSVVTIKLYDMVGKLIQNIVTNESYEKGDYQIHTNTNQLSKGIYIVKCTINNQDFSYKVIKK